MLWLSICSTCSRKLPFSRRHSSALLRTFSITARHVATRVRHTACSTASLRSATVLDLPLYLHLRLQITLQKKSGGVKAGEYRTPPNAHFLGNQTVLEVVPEPDLVSVAQWGNVPICWNHLVCSRLGEGRQRLCRPLQNPRRTALR